MSGLTLSLGAVVETKDLIETVVYSIVAGIGVTAIFSVAIWGALYRSQPGRPAR